MELKLSVIISRVRYFAQCRRSIIVRYRLLAGPHCHIRGEVITPRHITTAYYLACSDRPILGDHSWYCWQDRPPSHISPEVITASYYPLSWTDRHEVPPACCGRRWQNLHNILMVLARYSVTMHHDLMHKSQFGCCDPKRGRQLARMHNPGNALLHNPR